MKLALFLVLMATSGWSAEFILQDLDCKVMGPDGSKIMVVQGDKSESTCVVIGEEASCHFKNLETGKSHGEPTKFEALELNGIHIWTSGSGNIKMLLDEQGKQYFYGSSHLVLEKGTILCKECVGKIVSHVK